MTKEQIERLPLWAQTDVKALWLENDLLRKMIIDIKGEIDMNRFLLDKKNQTTFETINFNLKNKFDMENKTLTNHENGNDANRFLTDLKKLKQMDKEKQVLELFNKYYEYVRTTDDGEQRGEWKRDFARQVVKLFCQPNVSGSLQDLKQIIRDLIETYIINLDDNGNPKASITDIMKLTDRAVKLVGNDR